MPTLLVVGDYAWDVLIRTETELLRSGDIFGRVQLAPGGSAANVAVWASRCGLQTTFVGKIGEDSFGELAHRELEGEGVRGHFVMTGEHPTGAVAVWIDHQGERSMVSGKGADHYLLPAELPAGLLDGAHHLHLSAWSFFDDPPRAAAREAALRVSRAGGGVSFDPGSFQMILEMGVERFLELTTDLGVSVLFPNLQEGQVLSGETEPSAAAQRLSELYGGAMVLLKLEEEGAYLYTQEGGTHFPTRARNVVDATGAGDAFAGAFLAAWLGGVGPAIAAARANEVAGWVVAQVGARPAADQELTAMLEGWRRTRSDGRLGR